MQITHDTHSSYRSQVADVRPYARRHARAFVSRARACGQERACAVQFALQSESSDGDASERPGTLLACGSQKHAARDRMRLAIACGCCSLARACSLARTCSLALPLGRRPPPLACTRSLGGPATARSLARRSLARRSLARRSLACLPDHGSLTHCSLTHCSLARHSPAGPPYARVPPALAGGSVTMASVRSVSTGGALGRLGLDRHEVEPARGARDYVL